jgi:hypothetical protein
LVGVRQRPRRHDARIYRLVAQAHSNGSPVCAVAAAGAMAAAAAGSGTPVTAGAAAMPFDTSSSAAARICVVEAIAAALAALIDDPIPAISLAADATISGDINTYDIGHLQAQLSKVWGLAVGSTTRDCSGETAAVIGFVQSCARHYLW